MMLILQSMNTICTSAYLYPLQFLSSVYVLQFLFSVSYNVLSTDLLHPCLSLFLGILFFLKKYFIFKIFIVIQLQLYAFSPHPSTPSQLNPPPSLYEAIVSRVVFLIFLSVSSLSAYKMQLFMDSNFVS